MMLLMIKSFKLIEGQVPMHKNESFWHCMDTNRDFLYQNKL